MWKHTAKSGERMMEIGIAIAIYAVIVVVMAWSWAQILRKSGNDAWRALWMIIPGINIIAFLFFAFEEWPIVRTNVRLRRRIKILEEQEHTMLCEECDNPIAEHDKFCSACGVEFEMIVHYCPNCNTEIVDGGKFCSTCGARIK